MPASPLSSAPAPAAPLTLREFGDVNATRQAIYDRVFQAASSLPPVSNTRHTLKLTDVAWADPDAFSPAQHRQAVLAGKTLGRRLRGTWQLLDNASGQVLDRKSTILATVPHLTAGGTFVNHGNDYVLANQVRLKNGAFARRKASGEYEVHANVLSGGPAHRYELDPAKGTFSLHVGQANLPLLPLLQSLGATDREIRDAWGPELFAANYAAADASALPRLRQHFSRGADLKAAFEGMSLDPKVTQRTLGGAHARLDKSALLAITAKLLAVSRGQAEVDDRDHLAYQQFLAPEDLLAERLLKDKGGVRRQLLFKASNRGHLQSLPSSALQKQVDSAILESGLGRYPEEVNPLELLDKRTQITRMGEGGIGSTDAIPDEARSVLPSHLGFLDPVRTPESERAGVDVYLAGGIRKGSDGQVYARFRDARTGKEVWKTPQDAADAIVAFPDALTRPGRRVPAVINGRLGWADRRKVDLVAPPFEQAFSPLGNLIPLKSMIKPQRMAMGSRFLTQALPLVQPEAPLVQSALPGSRGQKSYEEEYASHAGAIRAEHGGQVLDAKAGAITVRYDDGQTAEIPLYNNLPYNRKTFHHQTPAVTPGQRFGPGQLLATSNYTDAGGSIALGLNARIGLMPWGGSVADDTPVLCYDAAGLPHYGPIREVITVPDFSALATDPETLQTVVLPSRGLSVHSANTLLRIQTSSGRVLRATPEHSFMTLAADGRLVEIRGDQLVPGQSYLPRLCQVDLPVRIRQIECSYKRLRAKLSVTLDENFGFICGIYAAEGFVHARNGAIIIAATDPKTREAVILAFNRVAPGITHNDRNPNAVNFYDARLGHWLRENIGHRSQVKRVPDVAFAAPLEFRRGFVAGFWTGDGRVSSRPDGGCKDTDTLITSKRLRDGLGLLLASLSISTTHREYDVPKCTEGKIYRLGISTRDAHKLPDIRPYHSTKGDRLAAVISSYKGNGSADVMPLPAEAAEAYSCYARGQDKRTASRIRAQASRKVVNRHDVLTLVPESADGVLNRLRQLAASSIEWDLVESVTPGACTQWVYDFDMAPLRTFVCLDTLVVHNSNFEDAIVISESLAKRLTSTHAYQHSLEVTDRMRTGKAAYLSLFPAKYPRAVLDKLDEKGIARIGSTVQQGEPLILAAAERDRAQNRLHKKRQMGFSDATVTWEHADPGTVVDVVEGEKGPVVLVQSQHPMQVSDKMCYSADTEVLTDTGWYLFSELKPQQRLASLTSTGRLEYVKPAAFHVYDHVGRMYALQTTQVDLCVTDNHKLYAKPGDKRTKAPYQLLEAQALAGTNYHLKMDAAWTGRDPEAFVLPALRVVAGQYGHGFRDIPEKRIALKTYAMILGLFLSEGNLVNTPWHGDYGIDITQVKPDTKAKIVAALKQSGLKFSTHGKGDKFRIFGKQWLEHFKDMPSCIHKYIPSFVFSWSKETLRELYFWLMLGDGCEKGTGHNYSTTSRRLADDVQRLCLHIGYAAKVEQRHSGGVQTILGRRHMTKPSYSVRIYRSKTTPEINHPHVAEQNGQAEKWIDYRGKVYCVTLPRNHVIYVRRNGKACWAGNSARYGNKGVVAAIVPDAQMPHDAQGQPLEALFNPLGVISRGNPAQVVEMALSKVARKLGHPLKIEDFDASIPDRIEWAQNLLRQHGLSDREDLIDPATGRKIPGVLTGEQFIMKLLHTGESKGQARSSGGYDVWDAPAKGGESGAKRLALMSTNALLSHNAPNVLHDAHAIRGHKNENWWLSFMSGHTPPALKVPLVYEKFVNDLKASGINVVRHGSQLQLLAMTDADVDQLAGDRELQNAETVHFDKDLKPITGGLFDPTLTGGHRSGRWSAIRLAEPMPNPAFEEPIRRVLGLTRKAFEAVLAGRQELQPGGGSGPAAIAKALTAIDLTRELALTRAKAQLGSKSDRDAAVRKLGYLKAAQSTGVHPSQWLLKRVPVLPPQFRPVAQIADKQIPLVADANGLYRELFEANANLADMKKQVGEGELGDERLAVYHAFKAVVGLGDPITQQSREQKLGGILAHVFGSSPKFSSVQRQLLSTTVDNVGRAVVVPNPDLDMDSLGLPEDKAFDVYERYIARRLRRSGLPLAQALRHVRERTPQARAALTAEMNERPVIMDRAPVLHRFGIMAFRPHLVKGSAVHVPPLIVKGLGMDFDGNCCVSTTEVVLAIDVPVWYASVRGKPYEERAMRLVEDSTVVVQNDLRLCCIQIGDFPRLGSSQKDRHGADVYAVPPGVSVLSYDHATGAVGYYPITHFTVHPKQTCVQVVTRRGREVGVSDNESLAVFNHQTGVIEKIRPSEAAGRWVPVIKQQPIVGTAGNFDLGWWYAALTADGWIAERTVGYSKNDAAKRAEFVRIAIDAFPAIDVNVHEYAESAAGRDGKYADSVKLHLNSTQLVSQLYNVYSARGQGRGALYKKLPDELLLNGNRETLLGLLSGVLDGDAYVGWNYNRKTPQLVCNAYTSSPTFRDSICQLARLLGVRTSVTTTPANANRQEAYTVCFSSIDMARIASELRLVGESAREALAELLSLDRRWKDNIDVVPVTREAAERLSRAAINKNMTLYAAARKGLKKNGTIGRDTAKRLLSLVPQAEINSSVALQQFAQLVACTDVHWDCYETVTLLPKQTVYDFEVPETKVFAVNGGLIIYDTVQYQVPASEAAVQEAYERMLPSRQLLSPSDFKTPVHMPGQEYVAGLFIGSTQKSNRPVRTFRSRKDVRHAWLAGEIGVTDPVRVLEDEK